MDNKYKCRNEAISMEAYFMGLETNSSSICILTYKKNVWTIFMLSEIQYNRKSSSLSPQYEAST